ncbi:hypothetical protein, partial [Paractinoplanes deccanensis]
MRGRRGPLAAVLALGLVLGTGSWVYVATRDDGDAVRASASEEPGLLDRLGDAARGLVGSDGGGRAETVPVPAGLEVSQPAEPGRKWPAQKRVREVAAKRTANGKVYQLSDGRLQAEMSAVPVNYRDAKGTFQPIDTSVKPTGRAGYVQGNATNTFTSLFGDETDELVRFEKDGRSIELGLPGAARKVAPKVSGSTVTYPVDGVELV